MQPAGDFRLKAEATGIIRFPLENLQESQYFGSFGST